MAAPRLQQGGAFGKGSNMGHNIHVPARDHREQGGARLLMLLALAVIAAAALLFPGTAQAADSDGDGFADDVEIRLASNPFDPTSRPEDLSVAGSCAGGGDDDGDGTKDSADRGCLDTDGDGHSDHSETVMFSSAGNPVSVPEDVAALGTCTDGIDNDADGAIDAADYGCLDSDLDGYANPQEVAAGSNNGNPASVPEHPYIGNTCFDFRDNDADGLIDGADPSCPSASPDTDRDGVPDSSDNCRLVPNPDQRDSDGDRFGDACDAFPFDRTEWEDFDRDGIGDNADPDDDNDGQSDIDEMTCGSNPRNGSSLSPDNDRDGIPDCVDPDDDNDGTPDVYDAFPFDPSEQIDSDGDGIGDNADPDDDNDGQSDADELACGSDPRDPLRMSPDNDGDGSPDCVDADDDDDTVDDATDNCPMVSNTDQTNSDGANSAAGRPGEDTDGDACDDDDDGDGYSDARETAMGHNPTSYCVIMRADVDGDSNITILDLSMAASAFNKSIPPANPRLDQDGDSAVTILDLSRMAGSYQRATTACAP